MKQASDFDGLSFDPFSLFRNGFAAFKVDVIAHELTPASRAALRSNAFDAIISQDTGHLVRSAARLLKATTDRAPFDRAQERIRIDIYLRENIPAATLEHREDPS